MVTDAYKKDGLDCLAIENDYLKAEFLPILGAKMITLVNKKTGRQFLLESQAPNGHYRQAVYGANFADYDTSGFDDCFPTVAACEYRSLSEPQRRFDLLLPDHGELWCRGWNYTIGENQIIFTIAGVRLSYELHKIITLVENKLSVHYCLRNTAANPLSYLWSAHPLLRVQPGDRLILPPEVKQVLLNGATDPAVGKFEDLLPWPYLAGSKNNVDFSIVQDHNFGCAVKCFSEPLTAGFAGVYFPSSDESLLFEFDAKIIPFLGLWLCYGGWPENRYLRHLTVGLEPTNGRPDALAEAVRRQECTELSGYQETNWQLTISVQQGIPIRFEQNQLSN